MLLAPAVHQSPRRIACASKIFLFIYLRTLFYPELRGGRNAALPTPLPSIVSALFSSPRRGGGSDYREFLQNPLQFACQRCLPALSLQLTTIKLSNPFALKTIQIAGVGYILQRACHLKYYFKSRALEPGIGRSPVRGFLHRPPRITDHAFTRP
jgi:hypothetical protein